MRGASALGRAVAASGSDRVRVLLVWMPVLPTDDGPPSARTRRRAGDPRIVQFWDEQHVVSGRLRDLARQRPDLAPDAMEIGDETVVWDVVAVYPPGSPWQDPFPVPEWHGFPVVAHEDELARRLAPR